MSNNNAFVFPIGNEQSNQTDQAFEKQTSPSWVVTFVRFYYRDTFRTPGSSPTQTAGVLPLVVQNDCVELEVATVKNNLTHSVKMVLVQTDIDYETAVNPGDFILVNMLNWDSGKVPKSPGNNAISGEMSADDIVKRINSGLNINRIQDGFKGLFRVQSVRKTLSSNPVTGTKTVRFEITGFAFTEFNNSLYFNPNLVNQSIKNNAALYFGDLQTTWANLNDFEGTPYIQELIASLIRIFLGDGPTSSITGNNILGVKFSLNNQYVLPGLVGSLLGLKGVSNNGNIQAREAYTYLFGIQRYNANTTSVVAGLNPSNLPGNYPNITEKYANFFYTTDYCSGNSVLKADYWNNVKLWSVLNQYTNSPLNELYTCFRVCPNGNVMPTVVFRQMPFTNDDFAIRTFGAADMDVSSIKVTKFMTLPRWKISPYYVYNLNIGKEESARINFVQYFAKSLFTNNGIDLAGETALPNYSFDSEDVQRSGLKPYIVSNDFSDLPDQAINHAAEWARVIADSLFGGQLKLNGSMECIGIYEPITVGDNLEFDNVVYHIEGVVHKCMINQEGFKSFRTTLTLSNGLSKETSSSGVHYAQMSNENAYNERNIDYKYNDILPGVAESQDIVDRQGNIDQTPKPNLAFPQPNNGGK